MSIVVKTDTPWRKGVKVFFPGVGIQTPHVETGEFEVEDENKEGAEELIYHFPDFYIKSEEGLGGSVEEDLGSKAEENQLSSSEENELSSDSEGSEESAEDVLSEEEKKAILESLPSKTKAELTDLCKPFPGREWRAANKEGLIEYLTSKLS